jgi:hypothetical protein
MNTEVISSGMSSAIQATLNASREGSLLIEKKEKQEFTIKLANSLEEREAVFRLAYQVYLKKGFVKENNNGWLVRDFDFDDETAILVVKDKNKKIVGTVTLVFDGYSKLPAQKLYGEELSSLRNAREKIVEISRLAIDPQYRNSKEILVLLINYLFIYANLVQNYSCLAIEVNPRHKNYYKELLCFEEIGGEKPCPSVENAPAHLLYLPLQKYISELNRCQNLNDQNKKERSLYKHFLKIEQENLVAHYLKNQMKLMSLDEKQYFGLTESGVSRNVCI